jgi:hypothetical protein
MKVVQTLAVCVALAAPQAWAQRWEVGGGVGGGFYTSQDVTNPSGSASAKIQTNIAASAWVDNRPAAGKWSGELRYDYGRGDLALSQNGTQATFAGETHAMHYDIQWQFASQEAAIQPFVSGGAGVKIYRGTGVEPVYQPLSNFALLSKVQDLTALAVAGAGVRVRLTDHLALRLEVHDFLTPFPNKVFAPAAGSKTGGWIQDIVPSVGLTFAK